MSQTHLVCFLKRHVFLEYMYIKNKRLHYIKYFTIICNDIENCTLSVMSALKKQSDQDVPCLLF